MGCLRPNICVIWKVQLSLNHEQPGLVGAVQIHDREMELDHLQAPFLSRLCWNTKDVLPFLICFTHSTKLGASYPSVGVFFAWYRRYCR